MAFKMVSPLKKYVSDAQRKAVWASKADGGKGNPNKMLSPVKVKKVKLLVKLVNTKDLVKATLKAQVAVVV